MTTKGYHHLGYEDRCQIYTLKKIGMSNSSIAKYLTVDRSTIGRELIRNKGKGKYSCKQANKLAVQRRKSSSSTPRKMTSNMTNIIEGKLCKYQWSPEQISGWMKLNMETSVSPEQIYQHIWKNKRKKGDLYKHLRHHGKKYNKRKGKNSGRGLIPNRVDIDKRPKIVEEKSRIGDWEIDTLIGKDHIGAIVSMVDRCSKYTKIVLVKSKKAQIVTYAIKQALHPLKNAVHTLTADNGKEFAMHEKISSFLNAQVYFAKPYHSWERGLNEHTNGLIRQYFPKKTRFDTISSRNVQMVENLLNLRPRKSLKFKTPLEAFYKAKFC